MSVLQELMDKYAKTVAHQVETSAPSDSTEDSTTIRINKTTTASVTSEAVLVFVPMDGSGQTAKQQLFAQPEETVRSARMVQHQQEPLEIVDVPVIAASLDLIVNRSFLVLLVPTTRGVSMEEHQA